MKKCVLKNFANFTGKHLCQGLFFNKVAGLRPETLLKKRLCHLKYQKTSGFLIFSVGMERDQWHEMG